jgi:D-sedoheptulose 7-phosphate isomerase
MQRIMNDLLEAKQILETFVNSGENLQQIKKAGEIMVEALRGDSKIISCGNGGSMSDAMHFAEELTGQFRAPRKPIPAIAISDPTHITCTANDYGFESIFSRYVEGLGREGDVLLAISTSGNSENVVNAALMAKNKKMKVVALTGKNGGKLADICDVEIRAPQSEFSDRVQEIHIKVIHILIRYIEENL